jgi:replicative DNA helicase
MNNNSQDNSQKPARNSADGFSVPEIEQAIVSAMLQWPDCRNQADVNLKPEHFRSEPNRTLFRQVIDRHRNGTQLELISFTQELRDAAVLECIGGAHYLTQTWCDCCHSPLVFAYYIDRLLEEFERLELARTCHNSIKLAEIGDETIVQDTILAVSEIPCRRREEKTFAQAIDEKWERMMNGEPDTDIVLTGIADLDELSPLRRGDMPLITGERKAGKSILALSIAVNVAKAGLPVAYFSLEDREPKVVDRIVAGIARIPTTATHVAHLNEGEKRRATLARDAARSLPITIIDNDPELSSIIARSRSLCANGTRLLVVDYAQFIRAGGCESRRHEVEKISRDLRLLALETNCPLLLLCQVNKDGDTRESKALEMDCTAAWHLEAEDEPDGGRYVRIPFQRNGESGVGVKVTFLGMFARIENYAEPIE